MYVVCMVCSMYFVACKHPNQSRLYIFEIKERHGITIVTGRKMKRKSEVVTKALPKIQHIETSEGTKSEIATGKQKDSDHVYATLIQFLQRTWRHSGNKSFAQFLNSSYETPEEHSIEKNQSDNTGTEASSVEQLVSTLLSHLQNIDQTKPQLISKSDIAFILLQWALKYFLSTTTRSHISLGYLWETWATSLDIVIPSQHSYTNSPQIQQASTVVSQYNHNRMLALLPLSTLNKVIPLTLRHSLLPQEHANKNTQQIQAFASKALVILTSYEHYHPTMDFVLNTLIPDLSLSVELLLNLHDIHATNILSMDQLNAILSTLCLLQRLQHQGVANPKKIFTSFLNMRVLHSFAFLYYITSNDNMDDIHHRITNTTLRSIQTIIQDLLWFAFFHPEHHLDGFRTAPNFIVMMTRKQYSNVDTSIDTSIHNIESSHAHCCYQAQLFKDMDNILLHKAHHTQDTHTLLEGDDNTTHTTLSPHNLACIISIIPLLIQGYISNSTIIQERQKRSNSFQAGNTESRNKKMTEESIKNQFVMWSRLIYPVVEYIQSSSHRDTYHQVCLKVINNSLDLLVGSHVYLPSYNDSGNLHYNFLQGVVSALVQLLSRILLEDLSLHPSCLHLIWPALTCLLNLNHHLLHDQLHVIVPLAASSFHLGTQQSQLDVVNSSRAFLITVCETYQKLRRLNHLLSSILSKKSVHDENEHAQSKQKFRKNEKDLLILLNDELFTEALSSVIRLSPAAEIDACWINFIEVCKDNFEEFRSNQLTGEHEAYSIDVSTELLINFIRSLPIDETNAAQNRESCEQAFRLIVWPILKIHQYFDLSCRLTNTSLNLCGWLIDLYTKCSFWLNNVTIEDVPKMYLEENKTYDDEMTPRLNTTIKDPKISTHATYSLQHLACHRAQQLHAALFFKIQDECSTKLISLHNYDDVSISEQTDSIAEAKLLTDFIVSSCAERQFFVNGYTESHTRIELASWTLVIKHLSSLSPYMSEANIHQFLSWLFYSLAVHTDELNRQDDRIIVAPGTACVPCRLFAQERDAAYAILCDASLFEFVPHMHNNFVSVGLKVTVTLIFSCFSSIEIVVPDKIIFRSGSFSVHGIHILSINDDFNSFDFVTSRQFRSVTQVLGDLSTDSHITSSTVVEHLEYMKRSARLLQLVLDMILSEKNKSGLCPLINYLLRLDLTLHLLIEYDSTGLIFDYVNKCRKGIALILPYAPPFTMDDNLITSYFIYIGEDVTLYNSSRNNFRSHGNRQLAVSGGECIGAFILWSIKQYNFDSVWLQIFVGIEAVVNNLLSSKDFNLLITLLRPVMTMITVSCHSIPFGCNNLLQLCARDIIKPTARYLLTCDWCNDQDTVSDFSTFLSDNMILLDRVSIASNNLDDGIRGLFLWCCEVLKSSCDDSGIKIQNFCLSKIMYLLCSISLSDKLNQDHSVTEVLIKIQSLMIYRFVHFGERRSILYATSAELIKKSENEVVDALVSALKVESTTCHPNTGHKAYMTSAAVLNCYTFLIIELNKSVEDRQRLSKDSDDFARLAVQQLSLSTRHQVTSLKCGSVTWIQSLRVTSVALISILKTKALYVFNSTDIALVFSYTGCILMDVDIANLNGESYSSVFLLCCSLIRSIVKQYPKRVYGCCPCLIATIRVLLQSLLSHCVVDALNSMSDVINEFSMLCETLVEHKSILKKHMVGLVLDFVRGMDVMDPVYKNKISAPLYFLVDMFSVHENNQLNALMNDREKNIFHVLYLNYQKNHLYQGQY